jgi:hypothetical protein
MCSCMKLNETTDCEPNGMATSCKVRTTNLSIVQLRRHDNVVANCISLYRTKARDSHDECPHKHKIS